MRWLHGTENLQNRDDETVSEMERTCPPVAWATLPISIRRQSVSATVSTDTTTLNGIFQLKLLLIIGMHAYL